MLFATRIAISKHVQPQVSRDGGGAGRAARLIEYANAPIGEMAAAAAVAGPADKLHEAHCVALIFADAKPRIQIRLRLPMVVIN